MTFFALKRRVEVLPSDSDSGVLKFLDAEESSVESLEEKDESWDK